MQFASRLDAWIRNHTILWLFSFSVLYWIGTASIAASRPLWYDEIFTVSVARLPSLKQLSLAISNGVDTTPPLFNLVTRLSTRLPFSAEVTVRLPAMLGFWVMSLCVFRFVARNCSHVAAMAAMLVPFVTGAEYYATEARPYGLVLGFTGLALLFWQSAANPHCQRSSALCLALCISAAVCAHYFAIMTILPLAVGELVRSISRHRTCWAVWMAFAAGGLVLLFCVSDIRMALSFAGNHWSDPSWEAIPSFYTKLLQPAIPWSIPPLLLMLMLYGIGYRQSPQRSGGLAPISETITAAAFVILPAITVILSMFFTHMFTFRYALPALVGFCVSAGLLLSKPGREPVAAAFLVVLLCQFSFHEALRFRQLLRLGPTPRSPSVLSFDNPSRLPVVVEDPIRFLELVRYSGEPLRQWFCYVASPRDALRLRAANDPDRSLLLLRDFSPIRVATYEAFVTTHQKFLVYSGPSSFGWLLWKLAEDGAEVRLEERRGNESLFQVIPRIPRIPRRLGCNCAADGVSSSSVVTRKGGLTVEVN